MLAARFRQAFEAWETIEGKIPESPEVLQKAMAQKTDAEREQLAKNQQQLQDELATLMLKQQELMRELVDDIRAIERSFAARLIKPTIEDIKRRFANEQVSGYLDQVGEHMLEHVDRFRDQGEPRPGTACGFTVKMISMGALSTTHPKS